MHLILTHDQADFDAVASLHAAALLDAEAVAALPKRVNRNVRGFLTLYGDQFRFQELGELRAKRLTRVTLVDTQSMISVRGFRGDTHVVVIDHHPGEADLNPRWEAHLERVGATATLMVEALQEADVRLRSPSATLLLLGIYEDTGSLTYASTTARDVRACAWLLEWNANLEVANGFLNQPLTPGQRELYDRLLESAETREYQGQPVMIAAASGGDIADEISTLAHKLGDVFDVAALFLLVELNGRVQLVARSNSESIDVARVAARFGGGGHGRAAAALIRDGDLASIQAQLTQILSEVVEPVRTVAEIMSRGPQLLSPDETVAAAADRMRRYGHEGYPVTQAGKVVGLLTRRAVDRAMSHGMGKRPISEIMEAGEIVVQPQDSLRHLQRMMIEHQWGQVPVWDPDRREVIGIVTRTDLLNILAEEGGPAAEASMAEQLEAALPAARLALLKLVAAEAEALGLALYLVGGFVRDLCLGIPSVDFDLVVEGDAISLANRLGERYGGKVSSHRRFGTSKWSLDPQHSKLVNALGGAAPGPNGLPASLDFVTARTEFYTHPTALPSVSRSSIKLDLHRRDFSINTLALRLDGRFYGQLLDHWGGGKDLQEGQIRVLHSLSFVDDPTRMLRAARLEQRLGFSIEKRTLELLGQALPLMDSLSGDRIRTELSLIFREARVTAIMQRLHQLGCLQEIHPALPWSDVLAERFEAARSFEPPSSWKLEAAPASETLLFAVWLADLPAAEVAAVADRLHFSMALRTNVLHTCRLACDLSAPGTRLKPSEVVACLEDVPEGAMVATWLVLARQPDARQTLSRYLENWRWVSPTIDGQRLRELGLPPGPAYARILSALRDAWLDGEISSAEEEQRLLKGLLRASMPEQ